MAAEELVMFPKGKSFSVSKSGYRSKASFKLVKRIAA